MTEGSAKILIVDESVALCTQISGFLQNEGILSVVAHSGAAALEKIRAETPDVLIFDLKLPDMVGNQLMVAAKAMDGDLPAILLSGRPTIREAVAAIRDGAQGYLGKPLKQYEVLRVVFRALNERKLKRRVRHREDAASLRELMGPSSGVTRLISEVRQVAMTDFTVLILGETGAGKDLVARAIHEMSPRSKGPLVAVDCGAIPETLIEGELFGHEKGSFTGADRQKIGKFEMAQGGTFFLDEVSNMPLGSQAKLLRVLQDKVIHRIGSTQPIAVDVRVLAASNRDLERLAEGDVGTLRRDVYFRLNEFAIQVPPLRERREDILYLAKRFLDLTNLELKKQVKDFTQPAVDLLMAYHWPGNVRQLRSTIRRAVLLADDTVTEQHLTIEGGGPCRKADVDDGRAAPMLSQRNCSLRESVQNSTAAVERGILVRVLRQTGGNKAEAARLLHIDYKTIQLKIKVYGLQTERITKGDC